MARHSKKHALRRRSTRKRSSFPKGLGWLLCLFAGILAFAVLYAKYESKETNTLKKAPEKALVEKRRVPHKTHRQATGVIGTPKEEVAQRFEFYQLLPGLEVPLPDPIDPAPTVLRPLRSADTEKKATPHPSKTKSAPVAPVYSKQAASHYMIQAKAYRDRESAEQLKKRLIALGFKTRNQMVEAEDGTWFRVMIGPFEFETMALEQKKRLAQHHIQGILILQR